MSTNKNTAPFGFYATVIFLLLIIATSSLLLLKEYRHHNLTESEILEAKRQHELQIKYDRIHEQTEAFLKQQQIDEIARIKSKSFEDVTAEEFPQWVYLTIHDYPKTKFLLTLLSIILVLFLISKFAHAMHNRSL